MRYDSFRRTGTLQHRFVIIILNYAFLTLSVGIHSSSEPDSGFGQSIVINVDIIAESLLRMIKEGTNFWGYYRQTANRSGLGELHYSTRFFCNSDRLLCRRRLLRTILSWIMMLCLINAIEKLLTNLIFRVTYD